MSDEETLSLFDGDKCDTALDVVEASFVSAKNLSWEELFDGFNKLYAITYSSGIGFICKLLKKFDYAEIIFGHEGIISYNLQEIMAHQTQIIENLKEKFSKNKIDLLSRIDNKSLTLFVSKKQLSHEKIYLLSADDGRYRVVMGSANMSHSAFSGAQRENICYMDGEEAFDWYFERFEELKKNCTTDITSDAVSVDSISDNLDKLPIFKMEHHGKILTIQPKTDINTLENIEFAIDFEKRKKRFAPIVPQPDKKGLVALTADIIKQTVRKIRDVNRDEKNLRKEYPQLVVDVENTDVTLNGFKLDLAPKQENIAKDVNLFIEYMNGYDIFHGDVRLMQERYFVFANWFFASPFLAFIRYIAYAHDKNLLPYPIFGIVYGKSKGGKTSFLETLCKMMIGQKVTLPGEKFTRSEINSYRMEYIKGVPIIVDDVIQNKFRDSGELIKNDMFGIGEKLFNYPAVVISANEDVKAVAPEVIRRAVVCRIEAGLNTNEAVRNNKVKRIQRQIDTAFYREYLRRMLDKIPAFIDKMKTEEDFTFDILALSSEIIFDIISENVDGEIPAYIKKLRMENYFDEKIIGRYSIESICTAWEINRKAFDINNKARQLRYNAGDIHDAKRIVKELPENLRATTSREWIVMDLNSAREFFGINFKKSWF